MANPSVGPSPGSIGHSSVPFVGLFGTEQVAPESGMTLGSLRLAAPAPHHAIA
jgi:hypothetical protein